MLKKIAGAALVAFIIASGAIRAEKASRSGDAAINRNITTLAAIVKELEMNYVDSIAMDSTLNVAIESMLMTLDPYTEYYTPEDREELEKMTTGDYGGVGSYITEIDKHVVFSGPFEGSPAARAGIRAGDRILYVDTIDMAGRKTDFVSSHLRGTVGTPVTVKVLRPYAADSLLTFNLMREKLHTPSVPYYGMYGDGRTGYLRLTQFIDRSPQEVKTALDSLRAKGMQSLVFDLRGNGGGLLESAVEILGYFLPKGTEVLRTKSRYNERIYKTTRQPILPDIPLVVLIDGGTASASEITAGAVQDLDRGVLVGSRSYGKGLVQSTRPLPYDNLLKFTVAKYYIPSGRLIQALDYSRRNPDGSVARTPDSLTNVFRTRAGREVRDGGGLKPDVEVKWEEANRLIYNLMRDSWIFNYATRYVAEHPDAPDPQTFQITDSVYADFKQSIDPARFKYDKVCEDMLKSLREAAKTEGYLNAETEAGFDRLATLLTHDLQQDLDTKRPQIAQYLAEEIISRYHYDRGKIVQELKRDPGLDKALEILADPAAYRALLAAPAKKKK